MSLNDIQNSSTTGGSLGVFWAKKHLRMRHLYYIVFEKSCNWPKIH